MADLKSDLLDWIESTLQSLVEQNAFPASMLGKAQIERTRDPEHGDFATNIALMSAKAAGAKPRDIAMTIQAALPEHDLVASTNIAGPGFLNIRLAENAEHSIIDTVLTAGESYGRNQSGTGQRVQVEYVSANPTGPLHVGHGRGAAYGATLANILDANGFETQKEYYVNDAGRQMDILAASLWLRYLSECGEEIPFPVNGYRGDYLIQIAKQMYADIGDTLRVDSAKVLADLPEDEQKNDAGDVISGDKELYIDAIVVRTKELLGSEGYAQVFNVGIISIRDDIEADLAEFGATFDEWFSEKSLATSGEIDAALATLEEKGYLKNIDGTVWFTSTAFGDEKDRVVIRENGLKTYFASDIAYFKNKLDRGFDQVIEVWGADHHGYVPRVQAAIQALGYDANKVHFQLVQFAVLYRQNQKIQMSTRSGSFVTLRELRQDIGSDAARFYYVTRKSDQHLDFDLDLAVANSKDNPMYYIQYAYARLHTMLKKAAEQDMAYDAELAKAGRDTLGLPAEKQLMKLMAQYPETIANAGSRYEPHLIVYFLRDLATLFHSYYNDTKVLIEDDKLRNARLQLGQAVAQIIHNGLSILGVSAPKTM